MQHKWRDYLDARAEKGLEFTLIPFVDLFLIGKGFMLGVKIMPELFGSQT